MKTTFLSRKTLVFLLLIFFSSSVILLGDPGGRTGRTLKSTTNGCGGCHGSTSTADVNVTFAGPDTVNIGQTVQFTLTVAKASKTGAGLDIATRRGALAPVSNNIHLSNGELTHNNNISMTNGSVTVTFSYTAPGTSGFDTLWATGLATNSNGGTSGDDWNWAANRRIVIRNPVGIEPNTVASEFSLSQNYPNPFNPGTKFDLRLEREDAVSIKIFDINGEEVYTVNEGKLSAGNHTFEWNAINNSGVSVNSGIYFIRVNTSVSALTRKMVLIK
jgi:FlgD Ig-like domain